MLSRLSTNNSLAMRPKSLLLAAFFSISLAVLPLTASAQPFLLPTANQFLFQPGGEDKFFVGTVEIGRAHV